MVCLRSSSSASRTVLKTGGKNSHILRGQKRAEKGFPENYFCPKLPLNLKDIEPTLVKVRKMQTRALIKMLKRCSTSSEMALASKIKQVHFADASHSFYSFKIHLFSLIAVTPVNLKDLKCAHLQNVSRIF